MPVPYDAIATGKIIRQLRKERNMTLQKLSEGICSIGKMSNIEHGQTTLDDHELKEIAKKLNTTIEYLLKPSIQEAEEEAFYEQIKEIEIQISLEYFEIAEKQLIEIRKKFSSFLVNKPSSNISLLYLEGVLHRKLQNVSISLTKFYLLLEHPVQNKNEVDLRSKAYIQLGEYEFEKNKYSISTIEIYKKALQELVSNRLEVPWSLYYNLSVLYLHQRDYSTSKEYYQNINHLNGTSVYLDALITSFSQQFNEGMRKIDKSRSIFINTKNHKMLLKSIFATIYFKQYSTGYKQEDYMRSISNYINTDEMIKTVTSTQLNLTVTMLQVLALFFLEKKNEQISNDHIKWIENIENENKFLDCHHLTLTLKALFLKKFNPILREERNLLLHSALKSCEESKMESSYIQIYILKELAELNDEKNSYSYKALQLANYSIPFEHLDFQFFDLFMPEIIKLG